MQADVLPYDRKRRRAPGPDITDGHPVEDDPDLADRLKAAAQADRVAREVDELRQRMRGRSQSISRAPSGITSHANPASCAIRVASA